MKHIFRTRSRIISYYENKRIDDLNNLRIELKKKSDRELKDQKEKHEKEIENIKSDCEQSKRILINEHNLKIQIESKRVENELLKIIRELVKQDRITKEISETRDALQQIFAHASVIHAAVETKHLNDRVESAVYLNLFSALKRLQQGMEQGQVILPHADVTTENKG